MKTEPDAPAIGSLWEHEDGERRRVQLVNHMPHHEVVGFIEPGHADPVRRLGTSFCSLSDWHAWAAKARRLA